MKISRCCFLAVLVTFTGCIFDGPTTCAFCPDLDSFRERFDFARNDSQLKAYYCGSDNCWHYFAIERRRIFLRLDRYKIFSEIQLPFPVRPLGCISDEWTVINGHGDWLRGRQN